MTPERMRQLADLYKTSLLEDVIPFWSRNSPDREHGGFLTYLDRSGAVFHTDKPVWLQGRIAWMYARLYNQVEPREEWLRLSRHGLDFLIKHAFDADGRMFFLVTKDGSPLRKRRYLFSEMFAIMALAEYAKASGEEWARGKAIDLFDLAFRYISTPGLLEPKETPGARPSKAHAMPMILLVTVQALREIADKPAYDEIASHSVQEILNDFWHPEKNALLESVAPDGGLINSPEGRCINPGHAIESAWFVLHEVMADPRRERIDTALAILKASLERGWDSQHGGLFYFLDVDDKPCVQYEWDMKLWWPHTEALYATLLAYKITGDAAWAAWHEKILDYCQTRFADPQCGEWFGYLHRDGTVSHSLKGNCWKGPYHLSRCLLFCWKLLEEMA